MGILNEVAESYWLSSYLIATSLFTINKRRGHLTGAILPT